MDRAEAVVLGAGVVGLTTALCLLEAGVRPLVLTRDDPADTTSALATAMVGPTFGVGGPREVAWTERTLARLATAPDEPGVRVRRGRFLAVAPGVVPPGATELPGYAPCTEDERPAGFATGFWAEVPLIDMPRWLAHLHDRLVTGGGRLERATVASLDEATALAPLVANCTGLGARRLADDDTVRPLRGPRLVVTNPGIDTFTMVGPPGPEGTSVHPHGGHVVLGGSRHHRWDTTPDLDEQAAILARCTAVEPRLADAELVSHEVGLRPDRPEVRLELEQRSGARVVHDYGHGGLGVTFSWGCAEEAVSLLLDGAPVSP